MYSNEDYGQQRLRAEELMRKARTMGDVLVGTLVERQVVKLRECQGYRADAILACLEGIRRAAERSPEFAKMNRVIRNDGSIDLWIEEPGERWRSAAFTLQVRGGFSARDLALVLSTYVPFGAEGDRSAYPIDESQHYKRGTQEVRAAFKVQARQSIRQAVNTSDSEETANNSVFVNERSSRAEASASSSQKHHESVGNSRGKEHTVNDPAPSGGHRKTESERTGRTSEYGSERRSEYSTSASQEHSQSAREQEERNSRRASVREQNTVTEVTQEVSFVAVGIDFAKTDMLWKSWMADPANANIGTMIELVLMTMPALGEAIEEGVVNRRRSNRTDISAVVGDELTPEFWNRVEAFIPIDRYGGMWPRKVLKHDGEARPISANDIQLALEACQPGMLSASDAARRLFA